MRQFIYFHTINQNKTKLHDDIAIVYAKNKDHAVTILKEYYSDVPDSSIKELPSPNEDLMGHIEIISEY